MRFALLAVLAFGWFAIPAPAADPSQTREYLAGMWLLVRSLRPVPGDAATAENAEGSMAGRPTGPLTHGPLARGRIEATTTGGGSSTAGWPPRRSSGR